MSRIHVIGAGSRLGAAVARAAAGRGIDVVGIARTNVPAGGIRADATDPSALADALGDARTVISCIHARFATAIAAALPPNAERLVITGSTRAFTRIPDEAAYEVRAAETAVLESRVPACVIHPTMIYGAHGENSVRRIAAIIGKFGVVPLPAGGAALVQPVHLDDVARCLVSACFAPDAIGKAIVVAGPRALSYGDFVRAIGKQIGRPVRIVPAPAGLLKIAARATRFVPGLPSVNEAEIDRLLEDKVFATDDMIRILRVIPRSLEAGLAETFARAS